MAAQSRFYVTVNDVKLHFIEHSQAGPAVLLLPGITSPAIVWSFVVERMAPHAHVFVLDNRGRGLSDQRPGLSYTLDDYAADAAGVIRALGLSAPVVLGHSMGGRIGIRVASRHPDAVGRLLLADPPVSGPGRRAYPSPLQQYFDRMDALSRGEPLAPSAIYTPEQERLRAEWIPTCSREAVAASHRGLQEEDIFGDFPQIVCPTLLLYAEQGGTISDVDAAEIVSCLPHGSSRKLFGVGHMMPWFDLELFLEAIGPFIRGELGIL